MGSDSIPQWSSDQSEVLLGTTDIRISRLGVGTWSWGGRFWGYGYQYGDDDLQAAFEASMAAGISLFDTAEIYGPGRSERLIARFSRGERRPVVIATKFFPFPWRWRRGDLSRALEGSLRRLERKRVDLYQMHWPFPPVSIERWMVSLASAVAEGRTRAVGVSNYNEAQMRRAHAALGECGVVLASNQVEYSLLQRKPERTGLLRACRELGVTLIAYGPLGMGLLTGKYTPDSPPPGFYRRHVIRRRLERAQPLIILMRDIGSAHGGRTPAQVALNWIICKGAVPIPGAKNAGQARENAGALGWRLTEAEVAALDTASDTTPTAA